MTSWLASRPGRTHPRPATPAPLARLRHPTVQYTSHIYSGPNRLALEFQYPLVSTGCRGWVVVPRLGGAAPGEAALLRALHNLGLATLTADVAGPEMDFAAAAWSHRLLAVVRWLLRQPMAHNLRLGFLAAGPAAAGALLAAAELGTQVSAVVVLGGRVDLAADQLSAVDAATLLVVDRADRVVLDANRAAEKRLNDRSRLVLAPSWRYLRQRLTQPGALDHLLAAEWLGQYVAGLTPDQLPREPVTTHLPAALSHGRAAAAATVLAVLAALLRPAKPAAAVSALSYDTATGTMTYDGSSANNVLQLVLNSNQYQFLDASEGSIGVAASAQARGCVQFIVPTLVTCPVAAFSNLVINTNDGTDQIILGFNDGFAATTINGGNGTDTLSIVDTLVGTFDDPYTLQSNSFSRPFANTVSFNTIDSFTLQAEEGNNVISILSTAVNTSVDGRGGNDTIAVGNSNSLDNLDGALTVLGGGGSDLLRVLDSAGSSAMTFNGVVFSRSGAANISIVAGGDGTVVNSVSVDGGNAGDSLNASGFANGPVTLRGGGANDTLRGTASSDVLDGGAGGTDRLVAIGDVNWDLDNTVIFNQGTDTLAGIDEASLEGGNSSNTIWADQFSNGPVTIIGLGGDDWLAGGSGDDVISGGIGNDTLLGFGGDDTLQGNTENDQLRENLDTGSFTLTNSTLISNLGNDFLSGLDEVSLHSGGGNDVLNANQYSFGPVSIDGGGGNDTIHSGTSASNDSLNGNTGDDWVYASTPNGNFTLTNASLNGTSQGNDSLAGVDHASLSGGSGNNNIDASAFTFGSVVLVGNAGTDTLKGGSGNDTLTGGTENDDIQGNAGTDLLVETGSGNFILSTAAMSGVMGNDVLSSVDQASLTAGSGNDVLDAGDFNISSVTLDGQGGNDTITGSPAADVLIGGTQTTADQLTISRASDGGSVSFTLSNSSLAQTGQGTDAISGFEQATIAGGTNNDTIDASAFSGQVTLVGNDGNDVLRGGSANDSIDGSGGTDTIVGNADANIFLGASVLTGTVGIGNDNFANIEAGSLVGGLGANILDASGFGGNAQLFGSDGNDTLTGGNGDDTLDGGNQNDTALLKAGNASIVLSGSNFSGQGNDSLVAIEAYGVLGGVAGQSFDASTFNFPVLLDGAGGNDTLIGSLLADTLIGGSGNDTITGWSGGDQIFGDSSPSGGAGNDRLVESFNFNMTLTNSGLTVGATGNTLNSIEEAILSGGGSDNNINAAAFTAGPVTLDGAGGNDTLAAPANSSSLVGNTGSADIAVLAYDGGFTISDSGAVGPVTYQFSDIEQVSLTDGNGAHSLDASGFTRGPVTLIGQGGDDTLRGTNSFNVNDSLDGGSGNDRLTAVGDVSFLLTNSGLTGLGTDIIAGFERASLTGGANGNIIDASAFTGTVTLDGQGGADVLVGTVNADTVKGGAEDDILTGGLGADSLDGEAGTDLLREVGDVDFILTNSSLSGLGGDLLSNLERASLSGTSATVAQTLDASAWTLGPVTLYGGGGNDTLAGGTGNDSLDGGPDTDTSVYDVGNANVTLTGNSIQGSGNDTLTSIEAFLIRGGAGPNIFDASAFNGAVTMQGGGGNDLLIGSPNADLLQGEGNQDTITGNGGNDTLDGGSGTDLVTADGDFALFLLNDTQLVADGTDSLIAVDAALLEGGSGVNVFNTTAFSKTVYLDGSDADDLFMVGTAGGIITGGVGSHDVVSVTADLNLTLSDTQLQASNQYLLSGVEGASLTGGAAANLFNASNFTGNATLSGLGANDTLIGGDGDDSILGGNGDDSLTGNPGADNLQGEAGTNDRWSELADFNITLIAEGLLGEQLDTVTGVEIGQLTGTDVDNRFNITGFSGVATLDGGLGNDWLKGGSSGDVLLGKAGSDTIVGTAGNDTIDGGAETDQLFASNALTFTLSTLRLDGVARDTLASIEEAHLIGNDSNNIYDASAFAAGPVTIEGGLGNDTLLGSPNADSLTGDQGSDSLVGNDGADTLTGGDTAPGVNTNDTLVGGAGQDLLDGVFGDDVLLGGADNDNLIGASGNDSMDGGSGDDVLSAAFDDDTAVGTPGNDTLTGGPGNDTLEGGPGTDRVSETADVNFTYELGTLHGGASGDDVLSLIEEASLTGGGSGNAFNLTNFPGTVTLRGLAGNDSFTGSAFNDVVDGGADLDRVVETYDTNWTLSDSLLVGRGSDALTSIEEASLTGGASANALNAATFSGNTTLSGLAGNDTLTGGTGKDTLDGGSEDDTLTGNLGDDSVLGGTGDNALTEVVTATTGVTLTLTNNSLLGLGTDVLSNTLRVTLTGGTGPDLFLATAFTGTATLVGGQGNDTFQGGQGNDSLDGGLGTDRVSETYDLNFQLGNTSLTFLSGVTPLSTDALNAVEEASLTGGASGNTIDASGFSGNTTLTGLGGADRLIGGSSIDSVLGGAGNDTLSGGLGNDTLDGGDDTDRVSETADVPLLKIQNVVLTGLGTDELRFIEQALLSGGPGNNQLDASLFTGAVTLNGDAGSDTLIGGSAADELNGGDGADTLTGNGGSDIIFGGSGAFEDTLLETSNAASVLLTSANLVAGTTDFLNGVEVATITGGAANQTMDASAFSGRVRFDGAGGNDSLVGTINADTLLGGLGLDTIRGGLGNDSLDGGGGPSDLDRLVETSDANLTLTNSSLVITQGVVILNSDVITGFEQTSLTGGVGPNLINTSAFTGTATLIGSSGDDYLIAGAAKDSVVGGSGSDTITGSGDDDTLLGGIGDVDRLVEAGDVNFVLTPALLTGRGNDQLDNFEQASLTGGASANSLNTVAFSGAVTLIGNGGNDTLTSGSGSDSLAGGSEDDLLSAGDGADTVQGDGGTDTLSETADASFTLTESSLAGLGGDALSGLEFASLTGGAGNNNFNLFGWAHNAVINAGAGSDALSVSGTGGPDSLVLTTNSVTISPLVTQFNDLETLTVAGGDGDDVFDLMNMEGVAADGAAGTTLTTVNLLGGNGDDTFNLKPYPTIAINVDGGDQASADVINFQAGGLYVPPEEGRLAAEGQQPITYNNIEIVNLLQQLLRVFLPFLSGPP